MANQSTYTCTYIYIYIFDVTEKYIYVYVYISIGLGICNNSVLPAHVCPRGLRTVLLAALCWFLEGYNRTWNGNVNPIHVLLMSVPDNDPISSRCRTAVIPSAAPTRFPLHYTLISRRRSDARFSIRKKISDGSIYPRKVRRDGNRALETGAVYESIIKSW